MLIETSRKVGTSVKETVKAVRRKAKLWVRQYFHNLHRIYNSNLFPSEEGANLILGRYMFWLEKAILLADFLQLMGLYWITANPWPIPYPMVRWTQWFTWFNLDYFSNVDGGALNGQSGNISISRWGSLKDYAVGYAFPIVLVTFGCITLWYIFDRIHCNEYGKRGDVHRHTARTAILVLINLLYLPIGIAVFRLYYCEEVTNSAHALYGKLVLAADYEMVCWEGAHLAYFILFNLVWLPIMLGFPYLLYQYTADNIIYNHPSDHEKRLQAWEITFMMGTDSHFIDSQAWIAAPHSMPAAYYRFWVTVYKAVLLVLSISVRGDGTNGAEGGNNSYKEIQSALYWLATMTFLCRFIFFNRTDGLRGPAVYLTPFRVTSSNVIFYTMSLILFANTTIGTTNAWGVVNAITVNSNQTILLTITTFGGITALLAMFASIVANPFALWPSNRALHRIQQNEPFAHLARRWIRVIYRSYKVKMMVLTSPPEVADVKAFESVIRALRSCWLEARYKGSIFDVILQEIIEELVINHSERLGRFSRRDDKWDAVYEEAVSHKVFEDRAALLRLMSPLKRRLLNKLLALRLLQEVQKPSDDDLVEALEDSGLKQAYSNILSLERRSKLFLQKVKRDDDEGRQMQDSVVATAHEDREAAGEVLSSGDQTALLEHQNDTEELLALWEQIISALEEGLDSGDVFSQKIFTGEKLERWYGYRDQLLELLSDIKSKTSTSGFNDPALADMSLPHEEESKDDMPFSFEDFYAEFSSSSKSTRSAGKSTSTKAAAAPAAAAPPLSSKKVSSKQVSFREERKEEPAEAEVGSVSSGEGSIDDAASYQGSESDQELNTHELVGHDSNRRK